MAKDRFHDTVKQALISEGWTITDDPLSLEFGGVDLYVDLGAERLIAAEKENEKIAVEVKSFLMPSIITGFHLALGQMMSYRIALKAEEPERVLYLAIPDDVYQSFFKLEFAQTAIQDYQLNLIVYQTDREGRLQWIN